MIVDGFVRGLPGILDSILLPGVLVKSIDVWWIVSVPRIWLPETLGHPITPSL